MGPDCSLSLSFLIILLCPKVVVEVDVQRVVRSQYMLVGTAVISGEPQCVSTIVKGCSGKQGCSKQKEQSEQSPNGRKFSEKMTSPMCLYSTMCGRLQEWGGAGDGWRYG
jgi:hypothetical protein